MTVHQFGTLGTITVAALLSVAIEPHKLMASPEPAPETVQPQVVELDLRRSPSRTGPPRASPTSVAGISFEMPVWNVEGTPDQGRSPRTSIAAGRDLIGQVTDGTIDSTLAFYDKETGLLVGGPTSPTDFGCSSPGSPPSRRPVIAYDGRAGRWLVAFYWNGSQYDTGCVLISKGTDPLTGGWIRYFFTESFDIEVLQPTISVGSDAYYINYHSLVSFVVAMERAPMLEGLPTRRQREFVPSSMRLIPADLEGLLAAPAGAPAVYLRLEDDELDGAGSADPDHDFIEIWTYDVDFDDETNTALALQVAVPISELESDAGGLEQPDRSELFGTRGLRWPPKYRNHGRYESLIATLGVRAELGIEGRSAVRWVELRRESGGDWGLHQEGTWNQNVDSRLSPSIAGDRFGNLVLAANVVGPTLFPGLRYAGRRSDDPAGTLSSLDITVIEGTSVSADLLLGPASAVVDPVDDCTFYVAGQYNRLTSGSTRLAAMRFAECAALVFADGFESADTSAWSEIPL